MKIKDIFINSFILPSDMEKFCPKCGKPVKKGVFCENCEEKTLEYKQIKIRLCPSKRYFHKGQWKGFRDLRSLSEKLLRQNVEQKTELVTGLEAYSDLLEKPGLKKEIPIVLLYEGREFVLPVETEVTYSPGVSKVGSAYYEGILQLRNASAESREYAKKFLLSKSKKQVLVNKVVDKNSSVDYYFTDKKKMRPLALKLVRNFGGYISENPQLFSKDKQTSKDIYRQNILVELPPFGEGDVIVMGETLILVKKAEKIITGINLETGKKTTFSYTPANSDSFNVVSQEKTTVSQTRPELYVLRPDTYQPVKAGNPLGLSLVPGQKIKLVSREQKYYVLGA